MDGEDDLEASARMLGCALLLTLTTLFTCVLATAALAAGWR
jgi:hypothetical protein